MCCRFVLVLLFMCVSDSESHVGGDIGVCSHFFYQNQLPGILGKHASTEFKFICQRYKNKNHFATMYMPEYRIPLFSAYQLDTFECQGLEPPKWWFIEPELIGNTDNPEMSFECYYQADLVQAVNDDYLNTGYDKGHLNPASYHCDDTGTHARTATFTLTNAVPQDPSFNQQKWKAMEQESKKIMQQKCNSDDAQRFFVTGVIPSDMFIPLPEHNDAGYQQREYHRVNVPFAMWTAACCNAGPNAESFSFSYYARNEPNSYIMAMPINRLHYLLRLNGLEIVIFNENCFSEYPKSEEVLDMLVKAAKNTNAHSFAKMYNDHALDRHKFWH